MKIKNTNLPTNENKTSFFFLYLFKKKPLKLSNFYSNMIIANVKNCHRNFEYNLIYYHCNGNQIVTETTKFL